MYVVWGLPQGETRQYMEEILAECTTKAQADHAVAMIEYGHAFTGIRMVEIDDSPPDFIAAIAL